MKNNHIFQKQIEISLKSAIVLHFLQIHLMSGLIWESWIIYLFAINMLQLSYFM